MLIGGIDLETTGLDPATSRIIEVGAAHWDSASKRLSAEFSSLVYDPSYPPLSKDIQRITGLTDEILKANGKPPRDVLVALGEFLKPSDMLCAYNAVYEQSMLEAEGKRVGLNIVSKKRMLCAMTDVPYPDHYTCKKLMHLAWEHDIPIDRKKGHRAGYDLAIMFALLARYSWEEIMKYADTPWVHLAAGILGPWNGPGGDGGVGRDLARERGYSWEQARGSDKKFDKKWVKRVKADKVDAELLAPFSVKEIR